jgi:hypothetical protein
MDRSIMALLLGMALATGHAQSLPAAEAPLDSLPAAPQREKLEGIRIKLRALQDELKILSVAQTDTGRPADQQQGLRDRAARIEREMNALQAQERSLLGS